MEHSTVSVRLKGRTCVLQPRIVLGICSKHTEIPIFQVSFLWDKSDALSAKSGYLVRFTKMTVGGGGEVVVVQCIRKMERLSTGVQEIGGGSSIDGTSDSTTAIERSAPAPFILVPKSRVCHSLWGTRHENTLWHQG